MGVFVLKIMNCKQYLKRSSSKSDGDTGRMRSSNIGYIQVWMTGDTIDKSSNSKDFYFLEYAKTLFSKYLILDISQSNCSKI